MTITYLQDGDRAYLPFSISIIEDDNEWRKDVALWLLNHAQGSGQFVVVVERRGDYYVFVAVDEGDVARVSVTPPYEGDAVTLRFARVAQRLVYV